MKTHIKRRLCAIVSALGFLFAMGVVGGLEHDLIPLGRGALYAMAGLAVWAVATHVGGFTRRRHRP